MPHRLGLPHETRMTPEPEESYLDKLRLSRGSAYLDKLRIGRSADLEGAELGQLGTGGPAHTRAGFERLLDKGFSSEEERHSALENERISRGLPVAYDFRIGASLKETNDALEDYLSRTPDPESRVMEALGEGLVGPAFQAIGETIGGVGKGVGAVGKKWWESTFFPPEVDPDVAQFEKAVTDKTAFGPTGQPLQPVPHGWTQGKGRGGFLETVTGQTIAEENVALLTSTFGARQEQARKYREQGMSTFQAAMKAQEEVPLPSVSLPLLPFEVPLPGGRSFQKVDFGVQGALELALDPWNVGIGLGAVTKLGSFGARQVTKIGARKITETAAQRLARETAEEAVTPVTREAAGEVEQLQSRLANIDRQLVSGMPDELLEAPSGRRPFAQYELPEGQVVGAMERLSIEQEQIIDRLITLGARPGITQHEQNLRGAIANQVNVRRQRIQELPELPISEAIASATPDDLARLSRHLSHTLDESTTVIRSQLDTIVETSAARPAVVPVEEAVTPAVRGAADEVVTPAVRDAISSKYSITRSSVDQIYDDVYEAVSETTGRVDAKDYIWNKLAWDIRQNVKLSRFLGESTRKTGKSPNEEILEHYGIKRDIDVNDVIDDILDDLQPPRDPDIPRPPIAPALDEVVTPAVREVAEEAATPAVREAAQVVGEAVEPVVREVVEEAPVPRKHRVEELLEAGDYKVPKTKREVDLESLGYIFSRTPQELQSELDGALSEAKMYRSVETKAQKVFDDQDDFSMQEIELLEDIVPDKIYSGSLDTPPEEIMTFSDIKTAVRREIAVTEDRVQMLRKELVEKNELDLAAREAAMKRGIDRIGLEEAPVTPAVREVAQAVDEPVVREAAEAAPVERELVERGIDEPPPPSDVPLGSAADEIPFEHGIDDSISKASEFRKIDRPGFIMKFIESIPLLGDKAKWLRPANALPEAVQIAYVARQGTLSMLSTAFKAAPSIGRWKILRKIDEVFPAKETAREVPVEPYLPGGETYTIPGKLGSRGGKVDVQFIGGVDDITGIEGRILDIAQRPHMYNLSDAQRAFLGEWEQRNSKLMSLINDSYRVGLGAFPSPTGGVFLSTVDVAEDMLKALDMTAGEAVLRGRAKRRLFQSAADRMKKNPDFVPETDIAKLMEGMDEAKAIMSSREVFKTGSKGLTRVQVVDIVAPGLRKRRDKLASKVSRLKTSIRDADKGGHVSKRARRNNRTVLAQTQRRLFEIREKVDNLGNSYGPELSFLSGQMHELSILANSAAKRGALLEKQSIEGGKAQLSLIEQLGQVSRELDNVRLKYEATNTSDFELVGNGLFRYFPVEDAKAVRDLTKTGSNSIARFLEGVRNTAFGGDLSPIIGVQLPLYMYFHPKDAITRLVVAGKNSVEARDLMRTFREETMQKTIEEDLPGFLDFAFFSGQSIGGKTATEFAAGLVNKIPGFTRANEAMFSVVMRHAKAAYDSELADLAKMGITGNHAKALAADAATKIIPLWSPSRLGLSTTRAAAIRSVPTSVSFLIRTATLVTEATSGFAKLALRQADLRGMKGARGLLAFGRGRRIGGNITPQEQLSMKLAMKYAATVATLSVSSAVISAVAMGRDPLKAAIKAADPRSATFGDVIIGDRRIPTGGPYRGIIRMIIPREVPWAPVPVPFATIDNFVLNRGTPVIKNFYEQVRNRDYYGGEIRKGHMPEQVLRSLMYMIEGASPLTLGAGISGVRRELPISDIVEESGTQFVGSNVREESPYYSRNFLAIQFAEERKLGYEVESYSDLGHDDKNAFNAAYPAEAEKLKAETARQVSQGIEKAVQFSNLEAVTTDRIKKEDALGGLLRLPSGDTNRINEDTFRNQYAGIQADAATERRVYIKAYNLFEDTGEMPKDPLDRAIVEYYSAFEEATTGAGFINFDELEDIMTELREDVWTDAQLEHIERRTGKAEHAPLVQEFLDDRKVIEESGYFELAREKMKYHGLTVKHRDYMRSSDKTAFRNNEKNRKFNSALGALDKKRKRERKDNWEMEILLYKWGYIDTAESRELNRILSEMRRSQGGVITDRQAIGDFIPIGWR